MGKLKKLKKKCHQIIYNNFSLEGIDVTNVVDDVAREGVADAHLLRTGF